ncbi:MAG TPA: TerC family protein [Verrucomicrobiae bacterium]|nr:TerC family protein [Verrucomicrobiae bacterium]
MAVLVDADVGSPHNLGMPAAAPKWIFFNLFVLAMLAVDLGVFHRRPHEIKLKEALAWSTMWIALALGFNVIVDCWLGHTRALEFLTGYLIEKSLSMDNLFVFLVIFSAFQIAARYQHEVLFWGIIGALILRGVFIGAGVALIHRFEWIVYVFGGVLVVSGIRMAWKKGTTIRPEKNPVRKLLHRVVPVAEEYEGEKFLVKRGGRWVATRLLVALVMIETADLIFALDSIPAVLAITTDPFIVFTSNVFAILGLRTLYFSLAGVMNIFHHLHYGLSVILVFVGTKMVLSAWNIRIPTGIALGVVALVVAASVVTSLIWPKPSHD